VAFLFDRSYPVKKGERVSTQARMGENVLYFEL
jgi:hypothetical protein